MNFKKSKITQKMTAQFCHVLGVKSICRDFNNDGTQMSYVSKEDPLVHFFKQRAHISAFRTVLAFQKAHYAFGINKVYKFSTMFPVIFTKRNNLSLLFVFLKNVALPKWVYSFQREFILRK